VECLYNCTYACQIYKGGPEKGTQAGVASSFESCELFTAVDYKLRKSSSTSLLKKLRIYRNTDKLNTPNINNQLHFKCYVNKIPDSKSVPL